MKIIKNFALAMLLIFIFQLGFNSCATLVKNFIAKNITISSEDKSEHIFRKHKIAYGAIGAWAACHNKKDIQKGYKNGVLAGEIAYLGKKIARKRGLGVVGRVVHSLGVSMLENQILNKPMFSRYKVFLPPTSLEFDIQEGFSCQFLVGSFAGILVNLVGVENMNKEPERYLSLLLSVVLGRPEYLAKELLSKIFSGQGDHLQCRDSLLAGTPVFIFNDSRDNDGYNIGGVITVKEDFNSLSHEMTHTCQYREISIVNLLVEKKAFKDFPLLFSQDLVYILIHGLSEDLEEKETEEYDRIYEN